MRGAQHLSLCAKGVSRRLYCRDPHGERAPATCQVPWRSILPTVEPDPHGPREPIHLQSGEWKWPGKGLGVHTGCKPPAEWGVRCGRKGSRRPYWSGTKESCLILSILHWAMRTPNPRSERIHRGVGQQEPRSHASRVEASCPVWGPGIFPPVPGSPDPSLRGGGGALCFSKERLTRTPRAQSGSPSALPRVTPARPAQGGTAALPSRCLTESADGGGGMSERSPGRGGRGQAHRRAPRVIG